jgi:hypothetical protein
LELEKFMEMIPLDEVEKTLDAWKKKKQKKVKKEEGEKNEEENEL